MRYRDTAIVRIPGSVEDPYGGTGTEVDWDTPLDTEWPAVMYPVSSSEENEDRSTVAARWVCHLPSTAGVTPVARVLWAGRQFEVAGDIHLHRRRGRDHHLEVPLALIRESLLPGTFSDVFVDAF